MYAEPERAPTHKQGRRKRSILFRVWFWGPVAFSALILIGLLTLLPALNNAANQVGSGNETVDGTADSGMGDSEQAPAERAEESVATGVQLILAPAGDSGSSTLELEQIAAVAAITLGQSQHPEGSEDAQVFLTPRDVRVRLFGVSEEDALDVARSIGQSGNMVLLAVSGITNVGRWPSAEGQGVSGFLVAASVPAGTTLTDVLGPINAVTVGAGYSPADISIGGAVQGASLDVILLGDDAESLASAVTAALTAAPLNVAPSSVSLEHVVFQAAG